MWRNLTYSLQTIAIDKGLILNTCCDLASSVLLMTEFQTPDVLHEENWIRLVMLAYAQLWAAKDLATHLPRPWERYLKPQSDTIMTPSTVQRDFPRIISEIGTPARSPKTRGNSIGRVQGQAQTQRTKHPVLKKQSKSTPDKQEAA